MEGISEILMSASFWAAAMPSSNICSKRRAI